MHCFQVRPYAPLKVGLISTKVSNTKASLVTKTRRNLELRLSASGSEIISVKQIAHQTNEISDAIIGMKYNVDLIIIFGASAISDISDVIPAGIEKSGGRILRFGMPVDPGNLLLLAEIEKTPIIGAPGCARSIAENGFDWVLQRVLAGIASHEIDIGGMGVGGLLMETGSRPHPRFTPSVKKDQITAIVLAAGQSRRMGALNKMTVEVENKPMVRHVVENAIDAGLEKPFVVTGYLPEETLSALDGLLIRKTHNFEFRLGLSTSLSAGISALPKETGNALILLGDMPFISAEMIGKMKSASQKNPGSIVVATHHGKRGNPVIWPARYFDELRSIEGDVGAKHIIAANSDQVIEVELGKAASLDLDTPEELETLEFKSET